MQILVITFSLKKTKHLVSSSFDPPLSFLAKGIGIDSLSAAYMKTKLYAFRHKGSLDIIGRINCTCFIFETPSTVSL